MPEWVDYKTLREQLSFEELLKSYNVTIRAKGKQHRGPCPLPDCREAKSAEPTFSAHLEKGLWQCFKCGAKGNQVEFGVIMEGFNPDDRKEFRQGALILAKRFGLARENQNKKSRKPRQAMPERHEKAQGAVLEEIVNPPLAFTLKTLDPDHAWFSENNLSQKAVEHFGLGYCARGVLKGRIAIPLHDLDGQLVGYAGLLLDPDEASIDNPLVKYPEPRVRGNTKCVFDAARLLYHAHQVSDQSQILLIAPDFLSLWRLWQDGCENVVCLLVDDYDSPVEEFLQTSLAYRVSLHTSP